MKGSYNVTFASTTSSVYNSATSSDPLGVFLNTAVTIQAGTVIIDQQNPITVTLKDQNGNPLTSRIVQISINGAPFANVTTGSVGQASFNWSPLSTGNYTVAASYSIIGSSDSGYEPSSADLVVTVKPKTIINIQTTGFGTQSVNMQTAQSSVAATLGPPSYSLQFSLGSIALTVHFNGKTAQATATLRNEFGWICTARVLGACVMSAPFWRIHTDVSVIGGLALRMASYVPFGPPSASYDIGANLSIPDDQSLELGMVASLAFPALGDALLAGVGPYAAGIIVGGGIAAAAMAAAYTLSTPSFKSFLIGLLVVAPAGAVCAASFGAACAPELPELPVPVLGLIPLVIAAWASYFFFGVLAPFSVGGAEGGLFVVTILALLWVLYTLI